MNEHHELAPGASPMLRMRKVPKDIEDYQNLGMSLVAAQVEVNVGTSRRKINIYTDRDGDLVLQHVGGVDYSMEGELLLLRDNEPAEEIAPGYGAFEHNGIRWEVYDFIPAPNSPRTIEETVAHLIHFYTCGQHPGWSSRRLPTLDPMRETSICLASAGFWYQAGENYTPEWVRQYGIMQSDIVFIRQVR